MKHLTLLLIGLGFHYSWGYWISNKNKQIRIKIETSKNRIYLNVSKNGNYFKDTDRITVDKKSIDLNSILKQIESKL